jgi:ubiquinone/menaquinone biosynthesis C-methylase UbiE
MSAIEDHRRRARRAWSSGDWDAFSHHVAPVGEVVLDRIGVAAGQELLDVGTGSGGTVAIPAAQRGARVVASDVAPELFAAGRRRAAAAGVEIEWVDADAQDLPFADGRFDRVTSTFGAMFAPDHRRTAAELVRVCRAGGRIAMTTWTADGYAGELFDLSGAYVPVRPGGDAPQQWGVEAHASQLFAAAGAEPVITRERIDFQFPSVEAAVDIYAEQFGPLVGLRAIVEPQGRWEAYRSDFAALLGRYASPTPGGVAIRADYLLITAEV